MKKRKFSKDCSKETTLNSYQRSFHSWFLKDYGNSFEITRNNLYELFSNKKINLKDIKSFSKLHKVNIFKKSKEEIVSSLIEKYYGLESHESKRFIEIENLKEFDWNDVSIEFLGKHIPLEIFNYILDYFFLDINLLNGIGIVNLNFYCLTNKRMGERKKIVIDSLSLKRIPLIVLSNISNLKIGKKLVKEEIRYLFNNIDLKKIEKINLSDLTNISRILLFFKYMNDNKIVLSNLKKIIFPELSSEKSKKLDQSIRINKIFPSINSITLKSMIVIDFSTLNIKRLDLSCINIERLGYLLNIYSDVEDNFKLDFKKVKSLRIRNLSISISNKKSSIRDLVELKQNEEDFLDILLNKFDNLLSIEVNISHLCRENGGEIMNRFFNHFFEYHYDEFIIKGSYLVKHNFQYEFFDWIINNVNKKLVLRGFNTDLIQNLLSKYMTDKNIEQKELIFYIDDPNEYKIKEEFILEKLFSFNELKKKPKLISVNVIRSFFETNHKYISLRASLTLHNTKEAEIFLKCNCSPWSGKKKTRELKDMPIFRFIYNTVSKNSYNLKTIKITLLCQDMYWENNSSDVVFNCFREFRKEWGALFNVRDYFGELERNEYNFSFFERQYIIICSFE